MSKNKMKEKNSNKLKKRGRTVRSKKYQRQSSTSPVECYYAAVCRAGLKGFEMAKASEMANNFSRKALRHWRWVGGEKMSPGYVWK